MVENKNHLTEVAKVFFKLGIIGFGGPAVHIALMEEEVVRKREWMTQEHFMDLIGATNLIPGPNSTEMTMHCGHERAGWKGLVVAGFCFIFPAVIITAIFAWAYQKYGQLPEVAPFIYGIKPAIIAVIVALMVSLGKKALKTFELGIIGVVAAALALYGVNEIYLLFGMGLVGMLLYLIKTRQQTLPSVIPFFIMQVNSISVEVSNWKLFGIFLKIGSILYGSGYVLFAFLDEELVTTNLLSKKELIDAIAVGQFTPGPVFSSATFIGWQINGLYGALAATIGIFLPSFLFVAFLNPLIKKLRKSGVMSAFLDTVNIVSIALILVVSVEMAQTSISSWQTVVIAILSFIVTFTLPKLNTAYVIAGGALLGYIFTLISPTFIP